MAHTKYTTEAIVLHRMETGEADATLWLLTPEFGLIVSRAQSARAAAAKMRPHVQSLAYMSATLVRGKHLWRLVGTEEILGHAWATSAGRRAFARIAAFVRRVTQTEAPQADIFEIVRTARYTLTTTHEHAAIEQSELHAIAGLLIVLGHLPAGSLDEPVDERALARSVNTAIAESQL